MCGRSNRIESEPCMGLVWQGAPHTPGQHKKANRSFFNHTYEAKAAQSEDALRAQAGTE